MKYMMAMQRQMLISVQSMRLEVGSMKRNQTVQSTAMIDILQRLNLMFSKSKDVSVSGRRLVKKTVFILLLMTDPFLADIPFNTTEQILAFFHRPLRVQRLATTILCFVPWDVHFPTRIMKELFTEEYRELHFWRGSLK